MSLGRTKGNVFPTCMAKSLLKIIVQQMDACMSVFLGSGSGVGEGGV